MPCSDATTVSFQVPPYAAPTNLKVVWSKATNPTMVEATATWGGQPGETYSIEWLGEFLHNTTSTTIGIGAKPGGTYTLTITGSINGQSGTASIVTTAPNFVPEPETKIILINQNPTFCRNAGSDKYGQNVMTLSVGNFGSISVNPGQSTSIVLPYGGTFPFSLVSAGGGYPINSDLVIATGEIQYWYVCQGEYSPSYGVVGQPIT